MNVDYKEVFSDGIKKITQPAIKAKVAKIISSVKEAKTEREIHGLKKMKGCKKGNSYRFKLGDYRIGVEIKDGTVVFLVFGHRKDIYKSFP